MRAAPGFGAQRPGSVPPRGTRAGVAVAGAGAVGVVVSAVAGYTEIFIPFVALGAVAGAFEASRRRTHRLSVAERRRARTEAQLAVIRRRRLARIPPSRQQSRPW